MEYKKIKSFKDLIVWKEGHQLVLLIYKFVEQYPKEEKYSLVDQIKRAAISITSNIAEGFSRKSYKEKVQFYYQASGSLTELENQIIVSKDIGYLSDQKYQLLINKIISVQKLLNLLITKSKSFIR